MAFPDYYKILGVEKNSTQDEIKSAYKRQSLRCHPDRVVNASPEEKRKATEKFQALSDAYFTLSNPTRRREYDALHAASADHSDDPSASGFASFFRDYFSNTSNATGNRPDADGVFTDVFEDLLRPEVESRIPLWAWLGTGAGGILGFITANIPGMMVGGLAGNRLGAIRDAKGKSVAAVFNDLNGSQKAEILRALAIKVLGSALS